MKPDHDLHVHTYLSACCEAKLVQTPAAILALAEKMGVGTIGFADHVWANPHLEPNPWYREQGELQVSKLRADLAAVSTGVRVLVGVEAETVAPGRFGMTPEFAETLDFVLLSCSHFHISDLVAQPRGDSPRHVARHMLEFFRSGVSSGLATAIAHPMRPFGFLDRFDEIVDAITDAELTDAFGLAADRGVGIEITTCFIPTPDKPRFSMETPVRMLTIARGAGCSFTFGTDAHAPERQEMLPALAELAEAAGITEGDMHPISR